MIYDTWLKDKGEHEQEYNSLTHTKNNPGSPNTILITPKHKSISETIIYININIVHAPKYIVGICLMGRAFECGFGCVTCVSV